MNSKMYSITVIFFIISHALSSSAHWEADSEDSKYYIGDILNLRFKPISINIDTNTVRKVSTETLLQLDAAETVVTTLVNTGQSVQTTTSYILTVNNATGGLLEGTFLCLNFSYYWASSAWETNAGTKINGKGFPAEIRVLFINKKYITLAEAVKHHDGVAELVFTYGICSTPNKHFDKLADNLKQIKRAGSFTKVPLGTQIDATDFISPEALYYSYMGSFLDSYTGQRYKCSRVILIKPNPQYCITQEQFKEAYGHLKNFYGKPFASTLPHDTSNLQVSVVKGISQSLTTACL